MSIFRDQAKPRWLTLLDSPDFTWEKVMHTSKLDFHAIYRQEKSTLSTKYQTEPVLLISSSETKLNL